MSEEKLIPGKTVEAERKRQAKAVETPPAQADPKPQTIGEAIAMVQKSIGAIAKSRTTKEQGNWKFRGIEDVYLAFQEPMALAGLYWRVKTAVIDDKERSTRSGGVQFFVRVRSSYTLCHSSGVQIEDFAVVETDAVDSGDKAIMKAMSYAHKMVHLQWFDIATNEPDPEEAKVDESVAKQGNGHATTPKPKATDDPFVKELLNEIKVVLESKVNDKPVFTEEQIAGVRSLVAKNPSRPTLIAIRDQWKAKLDAARAQTGEVPLSEQPDLQY